MIVYSEILIMRLSGKPEHESVLEFFFKEKSFTSYPQ